LVELFLMTAVPDLKDEMSGIPLNAEDVNTDSS
jgi:hypothetical protein